MAKAHEEWKVLDRGSVERLEDGLRRVARDVADEL